MNKDAGIREILDEILKNRLEKARSRLSREEYERFRDDILKHWPEKSFELEKALSESLEADTIAVQQKELLLKSLREGGLADWLEQSGRDAVISIRFPDDVKIANDQSRGGQDRVALVYPDGSGLTYWFKSGRVNSLLGRRMRPLDVFFSIRDRCRFLSECWDDEPEDTIMSYVGSVDIDLEKLLSCWGELYPDNEALEDLRPVIDRFREDYARELKAYGPDKVVEDAAGRDVA